MPRLKRCAGLIGVVLLVHVSCCNGMRDSLLSPAKHLIHVGDVHVEDRVSFKLHFQLCNVDELTASASEVSNPSHKHYGNYLTAEAACAMTRCPDHAITLNLVRDWIHSADGDVEMEEGCSHVKLTMDAATATRLLPGSRLSVYRRAGDVDNSKTLIRARGKIELPQQLASHVQLVTGLHDLVGGHTKYHSVRNRSYGFGLQALPGGDRNMTETIITPRVLRALYGHPQGKEERLRGGGGPVGKDGNKQGIAAFDDFYRESDLCAASALLTSDDYWLQPPDVDYVGPDIDPEADEAESDLDTQYMTAVAPGVPTLFLNHPEGEWILDWAQGAAEVYPPDKGGPLVWSISYGFPEDWQCLLSDDICGPAGSVTDPSEYLMRTNTELARLAAMGVTVLVSSGDDGSSGFGATCPVDPLWPVDVSGGLAEPTVCPFDDKKDCKCGSFVLELEQDGTEPLQCILPVGLAVSSMGLEGTATGADCAATILDLDCAALLESLEPQGDNLAIMGSVDQTCHAAFNLTTLSFYSDCDCARVPTMVNEKCSIRGYDVARDLKGKSPFTPDFPASSPWITSVGATQVAWELSGSCKHADLLGPGRAATTEHAVSKLTGGFDGGGGFSNYFPAPVWQSDAVAKYLNSGAAPPLSMFNISNRAYPDISLAGHNFLVLVEGQIRTVGGTSASAPSLAGLISLLNERLMAKKRPRLGFLNPLLYKMAIEHPEAFLPITPHEYDLRGSDLEPLIGPSVTVGSNKCTRFSCCQWGFSNSANGWDAVTGHGTLNFEQAATYLGVGTTPISPTSAYSKARERIYTVTILMLTLALLGLTAAYVYERRPRLLFGRPGGGGSRFTRRRGRGQQPRGGLLAEMVADESNSGDPYAPLLGSDS